MNMCPVQTWKLYTSRLNKASNYLWQKPKQGYINYVDEEWFEQRIVGRDMLERFIKLSLSKSVNLEGNYTNHSIRAMVINTLDQAGFEGRHIIALSSHKHEARIKEYATSCPDYKRKKMFDSLSNALLPKENSKAIAPKSKPSATVSKTPDIPDVMDVKANLPTFSIESLDEFDTIDDEILANLLYDIPKDSNSNTGDKNDDQTHKTKTDALVPTSNNVPQMAHSENPKAYNTQVNTFNNMPNMPNKVPAMYFPHSNVTINYNFRK